MFEVWWGKVKQFFLKQDKEKGEGGGEGEWVKAKFYIGQRRYNNHCNNRIVLSFLRDLF